ncbi:roadblock/LC7 domain-containing protein [Dissulfurirhabdus thermomarina]|uniref:Roadblock/LC7 domain-containing protein n=1 Tax=Dissulfurirhabdus thermomarina TaxID=1765737 RepID=A0A6N9TKL5_DISTH|nr:roadblock/LC7 domain-containing protein [Dissulfurirhabdus thermomarina]NDY41785.1 roadblock/LC7 domain-containing protein [Dissulfurirhabdus thermomarina]NMX23973.1 roadblock/LC7 domain-containing protein [Dissulfurirhabdus thermomarina]
MADFVLTAATLDKARQEIDDALIKAGVKTVLLIDDSGNVLASCGEETQKIDTTSLAALAAANFGATSQIARLIGEEDFSLLFHKGKRDSIHFARIGEAFILITIFGEDVSLGLVRLRVSQLSDTIENIFENA